MTNKKIKNGMKSRRFHEKIFYWAILAIPVLHFCIFYIGVNFNSIILSMQSITVKKGSGYVYNWEGFKNFKDSFEMLFEQYVFKQAFRNSLISYVVSFIFGTGLSLLFSYYIYKKSVGSGLFKVVLFLPSIISSVAMVIVFKYFVENAYPALMDYLFDKKVEGLLADSDTAFGTILFYGIWIGFGGSVLMYLGSMNSISESIVEAAYLDGITPMKEFIYISVPLIYPTLVTFIVAGIAGFFTNQMGLYTFYGAEASFKHYTYGYYLYVNTAKGMTNYPHVASLGIVFTFILTPITFLVRWLLEKFGPSVD